MVKNAMNCLNWEITKLSFGGMSGAMYDVHRSKNNYINYKQGSSMSFTEEENIEVEVLSLLERLGYPMEEIGTYFYKNVIVNVIVCLQRIPNNDAQMCSDIIMQLNDKYSQFWLDVSRNDLDIGIKTFQNYISRAIAKVDHSMADSSLLSELGDNFSCDLDYANDAYLLATMIMRTRSSKNDKQGLVRTLNKKENCIL